MDANGTGLRPVSEGDERPAVTDERDAIIFLLCERVYCCSQLLTRAAERLGWNSAEVQELVQQLIGTMGGRHAGVEEDRS